MLPINLAILLVCYGAVKYCGNVCAVQLNISFPATGCQKLIEVDDEKKLRTFYEKRISQEVSAECLGDEWKVCGCNIIMFRLSSSNGLS